MTLFKIRTVSFGLIILGLLAAMPASAQTGVIAFRDDCNGLLYAMRGDGSGRLALPLQPSDRLVQRWVVDVTTSGPTTVVYYVNNYGLYSVLLNDTGGT